MKQELIDRIESLRQEATARLSTFQTFKEAFDYKVSLLGRQGKLTEILKTLGNLSPTERPEAGRVVNQFKQEIETSLSALLTQLEASEKAQKSKKQAFDWTLPGDPVLRGTLHPVTQVRNEIEQIFLELGFSIAEGPEVETDYYNFEALNVPPDHPARDMQDTFFVGGITGAPLLLRTHTSPVQIHLMEKVKPPVAIIAPGAVYRRDSDVSHSPMFHQIEGLMVDTGITFRDLKGVLTLLLHKIFGDALAVRFRPSFFPFTEPSAEVDIECVLCHGKGGGCGVCKRSGFLEILGCGMVDPAVFKAVGYDPKKVSGFAFGMGLERIAMLKFGIDNIRAFFESDRRFLEQF